MLTVNTRPQKSLGQNFLVDKNITAKIISVCKLGREETVLEIGPGRGELTGHIASLVKEVVAVELDRSLCQQIKDNLKFANLQIICQDILRFDLNHFKDRVKVIGNIPYYISSPIIEHLLQNRKKISGIYISLQKELGQRLAAEPGGKEYGSFNCFVQYYSRPRILFTIKKSCFKPQPKVDSVFMELSIREHPAIKVRDEKLFFRVIRQAFNQRRKKLGNSLSGLFPRQDLAGLLDKIDIDRNARAERLSLEEFARIADSLALLRDERKPSL